MLNSKLERSASLRLKIAHLSSVDSTNNYALDLARQGADHGTVIWADEQTNGRGQFDRKWVSEPGKDLLASIILRPKMKISEASGITAKAAEIIRLELGRIYDLKASDLSLKAPNDILLRGKKVCGILTESSSKGDLLEYVVLGLGINLNSSPSHRIEHATSFYEEFKRNIEIYEVLFRMSTKLVSELE